MLEGPDATIYQGIEDVATAGPDRTALVFEGNETTYDDLLAESRALASGLADLGVGPGDRVAGWLGNRPAWIAAQLAASYLGAAVVAMNTRYRTHELAYMLEDSGCSVLLTEESFLGYDYLEMLSEIVPHLEERPERGDRSLDSVTVSANPFAITGRDKAEMEQRRQTAHERIAFYVSTPSYKDVMAHHGWVETGIGTPPAKPREPVGRIA